MQYELEQIVYEDAALLVEATASNAIEIIVNQLSVRESFHFALTGGTLGGQLASSLMEKLNSISSDLTGLHLWFSDERFDSAASRLRNSEPVRAGLKKTNVKVHEVLSTDDGVNVLEAAAAYEDELLGITMDICVLGLGPDGHVASLFPDHWDPNLNARAVAITDSPKPPAQRVSFTMEYINSSKQVWIIAAGVAKAGAVAKILQCDLSIPAGHVKAAELTRLIVDSEAIHTA